MEGVEPGNERKGWAASGTASRILRAYWRRARSHVSPPALSLTPWRSAQDSSWGFHHDRRRMIDHGLWNCQDRNATVWRSRGDRHKGSRTHGLRFRVSPGVGRGLLLTVEDAWPAGEPSNRGNRVTLGKTAWSCGRRRRPASDDAGRRASAHSQGHPQDWGRGGLRLQVLAGRRKHDRVWALPGASGPSSGLSAGMDARRKVVTMTPATRMNACPSP
jgi:hypothetical protein